MSSYTILPREYVVSQYPKLEYSKKDVIRAGSALKEDLVWLPETEEEVRRVFRVANSWRASHAFPMHRMRAELHGRMSTLKIKGLTAARLKQMPSIRGKLRRISSNLRQMQDLGGCRAIVSDMDRATLLANAVLEGFSHALKRQDAYMDAPRKSGYRSHHLVFSFEPRSVEEEPYSGRLIEIQIRSRLQYAWATAVEAVGLYRGENLKADQGSADWLELFRLMSEEIALAEGRDYATDGRAERLTKIKSLGSSLKVVETLDSLSHAAADLERQDQFRNYRPRYCLIVYDHSSREVSVKYLDGPSRIGGTLDEVDATSQVSGNKTAVVVEVDKIDNLRAAYPNYFGDVQLFRSRLASVLHGGNVKEYSLPPIERVPPPPKEVPDDTWLRYPNRRNRRWDS